MARKVPPPDGFLLTGKFHADLNMSWRLQLGVNVDRDGLVAVALEWKGRGRRWALAHRALTRFRTYVRKGLRGPGDARAEAEDLMDTIREVAREARRRREDRMAREVVEAAHIEAPREQEVTL